MKKLGLMLLIIVASAFASVVTTYRTVQRVGPYYYSTEKYDATHGNQPGGQVRIYKNGVDTLFVGDLVYLSAANTVRKSATLASYNTVIGVVVGGTKTNMSGVITSPALTDTAALASQQVLVLSEGRAWVRVDTATGGIAPGTLIMPSLVSGKVRAKVAALDSLYRVVGRMIDTGVISSQALAHINVK